MAIPLTIFLINQNQDIRQRATSLPASSQRVHILVLKYLPTDDSGNNLNFSILGLNIGVGTMNSWIDLQNQQAIEKLTTSTKYHGYKDSNAPPAIHYAILDTKEFKKPLPRHTLAALGTDGANWTDYPKILSTDVQICDYIDTNDVKEVWIWGYQIDSGQNQTKIHESNMSMGTDSRAFWNKGSFGNVSNSPRLNNLPQCKKTYTVYTFNYYGYPGSSLHNMLHVYGHQFEAVMDWLGSAVWNKYTFPVGYARERGVVNHCGTMHTPPNSVNRSLIELQPKLNPGDTSQCGNPQTTSSCEGMQDYSVSVVSVPSDCEDWSPDGGGAITQVDCRNWYRKPDGTCPPFQSIEAEDGAYFYIWWRQNIPGLDNTKTYNGLPLRNWWEFFGDLDEALATNGKHLTSMPSLNSEPTHTPSPTRAPTSTPTSIPSATPTTITPPLTIAPSSTLTPILSATTIPVLNCERRQGGYSINCLYNPLTNDTDYPDWKSVIGKPGLANYLTGDYDGNNIVDIRDFNLWRNRKFGL